MKHPLLVQASNQNIKDTANVNFDTALEMVTIGSLLAVAKDDPAKVDKGTLAKLGEKLKKKLGSMKLIYLLRPRNAAIAFFVINVIYETLAMMHGKKGLNQIADEALFDALIPGASERQSMSTALWAGVRTGLIKALFISALLDVIVSYGVKKGKVAKKDHEKMLKLLVSFYGPLTVLTMVTTPDKVKKKIFADAKHIIKMLPSDLRDIAEGVMYKLKNVKTVKEAIALAKKYLPKEAFTELSSKFKPVLNAIQKASALAKKVAGKPAAFLKAVKLFK